MTRSASSTAFRALGVQNVALIPDDADIAALRSRQSRLK